MLPNMVIPSLVHGIYPSLLITNILYVPPTLVTNVPTLATNVPTLVTKCTYLSYQMYLP